MTAPRDQGGILPVSGSTNPVAVQLQPFDWAVPIIRLTLVLVLESPIKKIAGKFIYLATILDNYILSQVHIRYNSQSTQRELKTQVPSSSSTSEVELELSVADLELLNVVEYTEPEQSLPAFFKRMALIGPLGP